MSKNIELDPEQFLTEQVRVLLIRLQDAERRASEAQAAANVLAARLSEAERAVRSNRYGETAPEGQVSF